MGMFITPEDRVAIGELGEVDPAAITPAMDIIWIYPVMPYGVEQKVIGRATQVAMARAKGKRRGKDAGADMSFDVGTYRMALLEGNILDWQGPSFTLADGSAVPCTPERVRALNTHMPLVARVLMEIGERNANPAEEEAEEEAVDGEIITLPKRAGARR